MRSHVRERSGGRVMPKADWRSSEPYERLQTSDAPTFAWEFLDRNSAFHDDVSRLLAAGSDPREQDDARAAFAVRWGVRFRRRPRHRGSLSELDADRATD